MCGAFVLSAPCSSKSTTSSLDPSTFVVLLLRKTEKLLSGSWLSMQETLSLLPLVTVRATQFLAARDGLGIKIFDRGAAQECGNEGEEQGQMIQEEETVFDEEEEDDEEEKAVGSAVAAEEEEEEWAQEQEQEQELEDEEDNSDGGGKGEGDVDEEEH